jgi:acetyl-CoA C-acetyltransferase
MNREISLIGIGQTKFGEWWERSLRDLLAEAILKTLDSSPCTPLDIDAVIVANMLGEWTDDQAHLGALTASLLPHHPPALRVEAACASGSVALYTACALLESQRAQTVLVVGAEKMTNASGDAIQVALMGAADSEHDQPCGLTFAGIFALIAQRYLHDYGLTREDLSIVSAVHHRNAKGNPFAQFRQEITVEAVSESPLVADPLRLLDCSPVSDGAAACILSTKFKSPLRIRASQVSTDTLSLTERTEITSFQSTKAAVERAFAEAEITRDDVRALETHDCFSIAALVNLEDLGFAEPGRGIEIYKKIFEEDEYPFFLNRSGGLKACGHPVAATGVKQVLDVAKELQTAKLRFGLAHNIGGAGATCGMHILEYTNA